MLKPCYCTQALRGPAHSKNTRGVAVCIAGGPSLTQADVTRAEASGATCFTINNAYQLMQRPQTQYACDARWWRRHYQHVTAWAKFSLEKTGLYDVQQLENGGVEGLSDEWPVLRNGKNSGYQAINLAYLLGYKRIVLLGYDMQATGGKLHWHEDHPGNNPNASMFDKWQRYFSRLSRELKLRGVECVNATRTTALECFPRLPLEGVL